MQILAGRYKGINIRTTANRNYRPTQSRIRKSLFDILGNIRNKTVTDLFAGTGILGFEAISRGAKEVTFVEKDHQNVKLLYENIKKVNPDLCVIRRIDVFKFINELNYFDLILCDPPYGQKNLDVLIKESINMLNPSGILVLETAKMDKHIVADSERIYGDTRLSFWRKK
jgi:16S rRNA (guanine966-N2)-methyltransferase